MEQLPSPAGRVAFFGGSFDPPHLGHLAIARAAHAALHLDQILFAPVGAQPLKPEGAGAGFADRLAMTRLAIAGAPGFTVSLVDAPNRSGAPNYTLETLLSVRSELPAGGELFCLMGADSFLSLRHWHRAPEIPFAAPLIVASRPGQRLDDLAAALPEGLTVERIPERNRAPTEVLIKALRLRNRENNTACFYLLPGLHVEISATQIRDEVRAGSLAGHEVLPAAVAGYIRMHGLYR